MAAVIAEARCRVAERASTHEHEIEQLERQAKKLRAEIDRFAELALEAPADARAVFFAKVGERQKELTAVETRLRTVKTVPAAMDLELRRLEREAHQRLDEARAIMEREPFEARAFMRALFPTGIRATPLTRPEGRGVLLDGVAAAGRAFGIKVGNSASPAGFEPA
ncbi:hypothetical protein [Polyangium sp. 6x1]|uniref:hypothetical protein n=1 Tax=Polyangium sp. 6x1 TaxID=3042689 RepID=UPI002482844C|nr:hypothetical protein [Polyangium sp. 6x1]MDI1447548.1 hypothetical protein [Polyangium sp. 6x1]